jgi:hypothetical protein
VAVYDQTFVVDNVEDGYDVYHLDNCRFLQSCIVPSAGIRLPKDAKFAEQGEAVVAGNDYGDVYVFACRTGIQLDIIHHRKNMMVQTVAVRTLTASVAQ